MIAIGKRLPRGNEFGHVLLADYRYVCTWSWTTTRSTSTTRCGPGGRPIPAFTSTSSPTHASWLNRVEHWFSTLQRQVMDRGSFDDVAALQATLGLYVRSHNRQATPPQWEATADAILARIAQIRRTYETVHYDLNNIDYGSLMLQTGYFTLRPDRGRLRYDYPNNEVRLTFASSLLETFDRYATADELEGLYRTLAAEDYAGFCLRLNTFMAGMPGEKIVGETDCHLILHALCQLMRVEFQSEVHQLGGRSDLEVVFSGHVCVFEFKYNRSPEAALNQIEARDYGRRHFGSARRVVAVGLNFIGGDLEEPPRVEYQARERNLSRTSST